MFSPKIKKNCIKVWRNITNEGECKRLRTAIGTVECCILDRTWFVCSGTHSSSGYLHKNCTRSNLSAFHCGWMKRLECSLPKLGACQFIGTRKCHFSLGECPLLVGPCSSRWSHTQYALILLRNVLKKSMNLTVMWVLGRVEGR